MSEIPKHGVTVRAHVEGSLEDALDALMVVRLTVLAGKRATRATREQLRRDLAGVQADCETVKLWLEAGAPE